jgi:hypothetical protein
MNEILRIILRKLFLSRIIGSRHTPESRILRTYLRCRSIKERREFFRAYNDFINNYYIIRQKKRTKKGFDWHISLNQKKLVELREMIGK